jgi:hypothetical protein
MILYSRRNNMEDFMIIIYVAMIVATLIMVALVLGIIGMGRLIEKTPDIQELKKEKVRKDEDKQSLSAPEKASKILSLAFSVVFLLGIFTVLLGGGSKVILILGGVTMIAGLLFAVGTSMFELMIYRTMQKNMNKFNAGEAIGNG